MLFLLPALLFIHSCSGGEESSQSNQDSSTTSDSTLVQPVSQIDRVVGIGLIVPESLVSGLAARRSGKVIMIYRNIGDHVTAGEPIVQLDDSDEQIALKKLLQEKKTRSYQVSVAEADLDNVKSQLDYNQSRLETTRSLFEKGAETEENTEALENEVNTLKASSRLKEANLEVARSQLNELDIEIRKAREDLEKMVIRAPSDGQILQIDAVKYSYIVQNEVAATFAPDGPVVARCEIDEMFAGRIQLGQSAELRRVGFSEVIATGKVTEMSPTLSKKSLFTESPTDQQDRRVRDVRIRIDDPAGLLFNSRVECAIHVSEK